MVDMGTVTTTVAVTVAVTVTVAVAVPVMTAIMMPMVMTVAVMTAGRAAAAVTAATARWWRHHIGRERHGRPPWLRARPFVVDRSASGGRLPRAGPRLACRRLRRVILVSIRANGTPRPGCRAT
jgi:hypothetical protein